MTESPELIAGGGNWGVVRIPGRRFPGLWIPADTVSTWLKLLEDPELESSDLATLTEELRLRLDSYQREMQRLGEPLPFEARPPDVD